MSDLFVMPHEQFFSNIHLTRWWNLLFTGSIVTSLKRQSAGRHVATLRNIFLIAS